LDDLVRNGKAAACRRTHAQILLLADEGDDGPGLLDSEVADTVGVNERTVSRLRQRCVEEGLVAALGRKPRVRERRRVLDGDGEAHLVALMCSEPPAGQSRWTLHLLGERLVELGIVESISHESVRGILKKTFKPWRKAMWCIPPKQDAAFMCAMEHVLEVYKRPLDADYPVVRMDETSVQCVREVRPRLLGKPGQIERYDVAHLMQFHAPFMGW
jgi:transposase